MGVRFQVNIYQIFFSKFSTILLDECFINAHFPPFPHPKPHFPNIVCILHGFSDRIFPYKINVIFGISTSNNAGISKLGIYLLEVRVQHSLRLGQVPKL